MKNLKDLIQKSIVNEARMNYWMVVNCNTNATYLVAATTIEEAKGLVENVTGVDTDKVLSAWLINEFTKTKVPRIVYNSDTVRIKGDKKY